MCNYPNERLFIDFFTDDMLKELGVVSIKDLNFEKGSFRILTPINNLECYNEIDIRNPINFELKNNLPIGGVENISFSSISEVEGRGPKGTSPFKGSGFDAGHILGRQLFKGTNFNTSKKNKNNIYKQTKWSIRGNHNTAVHGHNQTYFENFIIYQIIEKTPDAIVKYRADLIYCDSEEIIPRGIHIRSSCKQNKLLDFNVFVPNVEVEGLIDYKSDKWIIVN
jgi:DNA-entry nuclease